MVACLVAWPLNESEAGVDLVLIQTPLLFFDNDAILMLISSNLHKKSSEVSIKTRSPPTSFSFKDQAPVFQTLDSAIHRINHYPLDNSIGFASVYPLCSDLSGGQRYPSFERLGPGN